MQSPKIKRLSINYFRGIPALELDLGGKSLLLKGGNGTGKSSVIEAVEFFFTGNISHLEHRQGISLHRHGPHVSAKPNQMEVKIAFDPGDIELKRRIGSRPAPPNQLASLFAEAGTRAFILRRSQLLEFVESDPGGRFVAIGNIMGVGRLDAMELELMRTRDETKGLADSDQNQLDDSFQQLTSLLGDQAQTVEEAIRSLSKKATSYGYPPLRSFKEIDKYAKEIFKTVKKKVELKDQATKLKELISLAELPALTDDESQDLQKVSERINSVVQRNANAKVVMREFLEHGKKIIQASADTACPFCGQQIDRDDLLPTIEKRIDMAIQSTNDASSVRTDSIGVARALEALRARLSAILDIAREIEELGEQTSVLTKQSRAVSEFIEGFSQAGEFLRTIDVTEFADERVSIQETLEAIGKEARVTFEKIGLSEAEERAVEFVQLLGAVENKVDEIFDLDEELGVHKNHLATADLLYKIFSNIKKKQIQATYNLLEGDIQKYFSKLHPQEAARNVRLQVAFSRRASTKLSVDSYGRSAQDPRAFESEGHLDSLGICIFLAFVKKFVENCPLVILDDVITTIDAGHRQKLAEVLLEDFADKQLIVTTHDEIWFDEFRAIEKAYRLEGDFKNMEIVDWDLDSGPRIRGYIPRRESIENKLKDGDRNGAANDARRYLEWILESACWALEVPVILRRDSRYGIGDLLPSVRKRVSGMLRGSGYEEKFEFAFTELDKTVVLANILSHRDLSNVSAEEVSSFVLAVVRLNEMFSCPDCECFVSYIRELEIVRCPNSKCKNPMEIRLHR